MSRRAGRGGTSLPGKVLMRLEPHAIGRLAARLPHGSAVISATNGKTTTAAMVAAILERGGTRLVHNRAGANMAGGVASALLQARAAASGAGDTGLFEVDEFWLGQVVDELRPRALLLANLFRDQLDRYGELDTIADRWLDVVRAHRAPTLVLNADDPTVADLGRAAAATSATGVVFFGVEDDAIALSEMQHAADAKHCRRCGAPYLYEAIYLGHLGRYHCDNCGAHRARAAGRGVRRRARGRARRALHAAHAGRRARTIALPLPGLYNVYNALGAAALALTLGAPLDDVAAGLQRRLPRLRPRRDRAARGPRACRSCSSRTRPARTRCCARSRSSRASTTCSRSSTTTSPTAAT